MSRFFSPKYSNLVPYTPGEQPKNMEYIKLNTNESPFPPSKGVYEAVRCEAEKLHLYSDPQATVITEKIAKRYGVDPSQVLVTNGSDEVLNFAFMAYGDDKKEMLFPDITYGFYTVFAELNGVKYKEVPLTSETALLAPKSTYASSITTTLSGFDFTIFSISSSWSALPVGAFGFAITIVVFLPI